MHDFTLVQGGLSMIFKSVLRRSAACLLSAALLCSAGMLTGCGDKSSGNARYISDDGGERSVYSPEVPQNPIDESIPGKDFSGGIGSTVEYEDKLSVTLERVIELDDTIKTEYRVLVAEMTIVNRSDKKIDCSLLTHFSANIDGQNNEEPTRDVRAKLTAIKYYTKIKSDLKNFNQEIAPGETVKGYVYLGMPSAWKSLQLVYTPYKYYSNDQILFDIPEKDMEHYDAPLG